MTITKAISPVALLPMLVTMFDPKKRRSSATVELGTMGLS